IVLAKDLAYRRVALVNGYPFSKKIRLDIPLAIPVTVDSPLEGLTAVSMNKADAYVGVLGVNTYLISQNGLANLKVAGHYDGEKTGQRLGIRKDWPILEQIISEALQAIPSEKTSAIFQKWVPIPTDIRQIQLKTFLSDTEKQWILDHPVIRVCADPDWAPVEFADKRGHYSGISMEYLELMEKYLGIDFMMTDIKDWHQGFDLLEQGSVDMFSAIMETESRKDSLLFTTSYLEIPIVIFTGQNMNYIGSLAELLGEKVCVVNGSAAEEIFKEKHPYLDLVLAKNTEEALGMLERKKAVAFVGDILTTGYYIGKLKTTTIKVAGKTPYSAKLSMAVSKEMAPLKNIMDKFFDLLPESEKNEVYKKWISIQYEHGTDVSLLLKILIPILFVLLLFVYWVNRLKLEIHKRQQTEKELTLARQEAEKANQTKSIFLANMSHEIRTPMNAILGYSQLLNRDPKLTGDQKKNLQTINKSGEHLLNLINDILELSKIEAGKYKLEPVVFDLFDLLNDIEVMFTIRTKEKGLAFDIRRSGDLAQFITADQGKMRQILINLMGNAVKFTQKGSIRLSVRSRPQNQDLSLVFELEDTGPGISKGNLERIFGSFEQAGDTCVEGGTGLGLAISRKYARLMAGDITVKSHENKGSVFTFSCRVQPGDMIAYKHPPAQRQVIGIETHTPIKVLIADDRETNRHLLQQMLERVGFKTREAVNGEQAIEAFITWQPQVILMDIVMPVLNGVDAIKRIRTLPRGDRVTIIAVTASVMMEEKSNVLAAGADGFLRKPFRENELFELMHTHGSINFIHEKPPALPLVSSLPLGEKIARIPQPYFDAMVTALELGHVKNIHGIIDQIGRDDPDNIAVQLKDMAEAFDFAAMQKLFQPAKSNR
ncbi:MAG: transporter substrate-binding domain-containing protein, partial [Proteobacteria bacterium]|nr:transporter substrate-binding domain-containing protein [Pseudomonadota bacterium]